MSPRPDPSGLITDRSFSQPTFTRRRCSRSRPLRSCRTCRPSPKRTKKVIVAGAGIGGLSCAWELVRRGHDVTVLEASARTGGHVFTLRDGLDDGLYADGGAEHFTQPGYERYWSYVREFDLAARVHPAPRAPAAMDRRHDVHAQRCWRIVRCSPSSA